LSWSGAGRGGLVLRALVHLLRSGTPSLGEFGGSFRAWPAPPPRSGRPCLDCATGRPASGVPGRMTRDPGAPDGSPAPSARVPECPSARLPDCRRAPTRVPGAAEAHPGTGVPCARPGLPGRRALLADATASRTRAEEKPSHPMGWRWRTHAWRARCPDGPSPSPNRLHLHLCSARRRAVSARSWESLGRGRSHRRGLGGMPSEKAPSPRARHARSRPGLLWPQSSAGAGGRGPQRTMP
jgi:hypothetical protein